MIMTLTGTTPLMMHNVQSVDDQLGPVREIKKLTAKRTNKTDEDKAEIDRLSYLLALYIDASGPYLPSDNLFRCLMQAGTITRFGKKVEQALTVMTFRAPLIYDGPRTVEGLYGDGKGMFVDRRIVSVEGKRIPRVRPIFPEWSCSYELDVDDRVISAEDFADIANKAGALIGIGDYRRFYGKFSVTLED